MNIIDGKKIAYRIRQKLKKELVKSKKKPGLAIILIGNDPASYTYVGLKEKAAREIGIRFDKYLLPAKVREQTVKLLIQRLNHKKNIHAILIQMPVPKHLDGDRIVSSINPQKDVDGFHPENVQKLVSDKPYIVPGVYLGILKLISSTNVKAMAKSAVILANSKIFAKPLACLLERKGWCVSYFVPTFSGYQNFLKTADLVISAVGRPNFIKGSMIKRGAILIDVGFTKKGNKVYGDVDQESVAKKAGFLTPVPGGVGPMTVAMLLWNTCQLAKRN